MQENSTLIPRKVGDWTIPKGAENGTQFGQSTCPISQQYGGYRNERTNCTGQFPAIHIGESRYWLVIVE
jgi:hypothetical protein